MVLTFGKRLVFGLRIYIRLMLLVKLVKFDRIFHNRRSLVGVWEKRKSIDVVKGEVQVD